jgi:plasmid replication initiation protein
MKCTKKGVFMKQKEVIKHSATIQVSNNQLSLLQRKIWNVLLANAYDDLLSKDSYEIKIRDLAEILDFSSNNLDFLKTAIRQLQDIKLEWNMLEKDREVWTSSHFVGEVTIEPKSGIILYAWGPKFRQRLHNPTMYAKINLAIQSRFHSKYSLILYELCLDYYIRKSGKGETPWIDVEIFRSLIGVENGKSFQCYKVLKKIISKSIADINTHSDIFVELHEKRESRKIVALKFSISPAASTSDALIRLAESTRDDPTQFIFDNEKEQELNDRLTKHLLPER